MALVLVLRIRPGGLLWLAPVCSSWVFLCLGTSKRHKFFNMLGDTDLEFVRKANIMVSRCAILIRLCFALGVHWMLEQPLSSLMIFHDRLDEIVAAFVVHCTSFQMDIFGTHTPKPTKLYSDVEWVADIAGAQPCQEVRPDPDAPAVAIKYFDSNGQPKVKGGPGLKATQTYTRRFGCEVRRVYRRNASLKTRPQVNQNMDNVRALLHMQDGDDMWNDADMGAVFAYLRGR